jgi:hypothetical protein
MNREQSWSKDPDLVDLYEQLDVEITTVPPLEEVAAGMVRRRRGRRATAVALSSVAVAAAAFVVGGTGDGERDTKGVVAGPPESALTVTEPDGSTFTFTEFTISCERDDSGRDVILVYSGPGEVRGDFLPSPIFTLEMPVEHGEGPSRTYEIPPERVPAPEKELPPGFPPEAADEAPFSLFVAAAGNSDGNNEASTGEDGAAGTFEVGGATCGEEPSIDFTVDGSLGSEVDQPPLQITGEVHLG